MVTGSGLGLTSGANKGEIQWVEEEYNIFLSYILREFNLQNNIEINGKTIIRKVKHVLHNIGPGTQTRKYRGTEDNRAC